MASIDDIGVPGQPATNLTAWQAAVRDEIKARLPLIGGDLTGDISISKSAGTAAGIRILTDTLNRWYFGKNNTAETGGNTGSDFQVARYDDAGNYLDIPFRIPRDTGLPVVKGDPTANLGIATKQYVATTGAFAIRPTWYTASGYDPPVLHRTGKHVTFSATLSAPNKSLTAEAVETMGTVPLGFRPPQVVSLAGGLTYNSMAAGWVAAFVYVDSTGSLVLYVPKAGTFNSAGGLVTAVGSWLVP